MNCPYNRQTPTSQALVREVWQAEDYEPDEWAELSRKLGL